MIPLPEPVYHQWRRKNMPWSLEFAFNSMCHATTDNSEVRTLHTADQLRAYGAAVRAEERERCAQICDGFASIEGIAQRCAAAIRSDITG